MQQQRAARCRALLLALLALGAICCCCAQQPTAAAASTARVSTDLELQAALLRPEVDRIILLENIRFHPPTWGRQQDANSSAPPQRQLSRNLTISSEPKLRRLDFQFTATNWLRLDAGVRLNITDTVIEQSRYGVGMQLDWLSPSPGAMLVLHNSVVLRHLCVDAVDEPEAIASVPRIPGFPGQQRAHYAYDVCTELGCFKKVVHYDDFAKTSTFTGDTAAGGYSLVFYNSSKFCLGWANHCADSSITEGCMQRALDSLPAAAPTPGRLAAAQAAGAAAQAQQQQQTGLAAGVGAAAGAAGLLLLLLALVLALRWRRRRLARGGKGGGKGLLPSVSAPAAGAHGDMQPDKQQPATRGEVAWVPAGGQEGHSKDADATSTVLPTATGTTSSSISSRHVSQGELQPEQPGVLQDRWELTAWKTSSHSLRRLSCPQHLQQHQQQQLHGVNDLQAASTDTTSCSLSLSSNVGPVTVSSPFALSSSRPLSSHELMLQGTGASTSQAVMASNKVSLGVCIGAGSFGKVYKGRWRNMEVAVKVVQHSQAAAASVANEVDLMMSFQHPHLVSAHHFVTWRRRKQGRGDSAPAGDQQGASSSSAYARQQTQSSNSLSCSDNFVAAAAGPANTPGDHVGGGEDMQTWIVQEYCSAGNLADYCIIHGAKQEGQLPTGHAMLRLLFRLREVADGMTFLHQTARVVHGDLKSSNILLCVAPTAPYGRSAKVADFGLSRVYAAEETHKSTKTLGTVNHMAPELLRYGKASAAADVYSFSIIMWELLTGCVAYKGWQWGAILEHVALHGQRPDIPQGAPEDFCLLMQACWQQDPAQRPSFAEVLRCLNIMITSRQQELIEAAAGVSSHRHATAAVSTSGAALLPLHSSTGDSHSATLRALSGPMLAGGGGGGGDVSDAGGCSIRSATSLASSNGEWDIIRVGSMRQLSGASSAATTTSSSSSALASAASAAAAAVIITRDGPAGCGGVTVGGSRLSGSKPGGQLLHSQRLLHGRSLVKPSPHAGPWPDQQQQQHQKQQQQQQQLVAAGAARAADSPQDL